MLQDKLIEGTGSSSPMALFKGFPVGARAYSMRVRQEPCITGKEFQVAYEFIGIPIEDGLLEEIRNSHNLSNNYGAIYFPKFRLIWADRKSEGIVGEEGYAYILRGISPEEGLRQEMEMRGHILGNEGIIYCSPEDFIGNDLKEYEASIEEMTDEAKQILKKAQPSLMISMALRFTQHSQGAFPASRLG